MGNLVESIARICVELSSGNLGTAARIAEQELATPSDFSYHRRYTPKEQTRLFLRDGFIDRFSGDRLVFPPVLLLVSLHLKIQFPYHPSLQPPECHPMYWDLEPTIVQLTADTEGHLPRPSDLNWITTSIRRAAIKGDQDAQTLGWALYPAGDVAKWDGLLLWFVEFAEKTNTFKSQDFLQRLGIEGDARKVDAVRRQFESWYHAAREIRSAV
jgi:hypothetical protein